MNLGHINTVFFKEVTDMIRDRRTLISMVIVPVALMPVLVLGMGFLTAASVSQARKEIPKVMVLGGAQSPEIMKALREREEWRLVPASTDFTNQVASKQIRAAVQIPDDFDAALKQNRTVTVRILVHQGAMKSGFASSALESFFREWRRNTVKHRLNEHGLTESILEPFRIERRNVASPSKVAGNLFGGLLPYMVILLCLTGGMYPAMDLTAGEKERGTMETILCSPVSRVDLVLGKFLMVLLAAVTTVVLSLGSMALTFLVVGRLAGSSLPAKLGTLEQMVDPAAVVVVFLMILPVAFFLAAAELAISLFARSFKEAQSYLTPLMFAVILPAVASMTPGIELSWKLAWIPILNTSLACKEIMSGTWPWPYLIAIFLSNCVYAGLALGTAVRLFQKEEVLMRT